MSSCCTPSIQTVATCPDCHQSGNRIDNITPQHTLKQDFRNEVSASTDYYFCETPECNNVYFGGDGKQCFTTEQLINRVTCKDPSPDTPLCYCFKISKGDATREYQESGSSTVIEQIEKKMAEKSCFCDKSNPRGICCTTEIKEWLKAQDITQRESTAKDSGSCCNSGCC